MNKLRNVMYLAAMLTTSGTAFGQTYITSYILGTTGNQVLIDNGGTLTFSPTPVNSRASATIIIQNRGTRIGQVKNVTAFGSVFSTSGLGLLPITLNIGATGSETRFTLNFAPLTRATSTGNLQIEFDTGFITINLTGQGVGPSMVIEQITNSGEVVPIASNGTFQFPDTALGQNSLATLRVRNEGEVAGTVSGITAVGAGFTVTNLVPLPISLQPQTSLLFNLRFAPTTSGAITGRLLIDNQVINLAGTSLGASFDYSFLVSGVTTPTPVGGTLLLPNTIVGSKVTGTLTVTNSGNTNGTITSVSISGTGMSLNPITLPLTLAPGAKVDLGLVFAPASAATISGSLAIDNVAFIVRATGTTPPAIPSFTYGGVGDTANALQQPAVSLKLANPYPYDLSGRLTLSFRSNSFADDPAIQFAPGGRTVSFTIPANATDAVFGQAAQVQFQTGSVAGTISVTPSFSIGSVDLTPAQPLVKSVVIAPAAPQLQRISVGTRSATSVEFLITGYSTSRSVSTLNLSFTAANGKSLQTTSLPVDVTSAFSAWYQSTASTAVGSQFTASVIINVSGDITAVQSVSATASNANGNSGSVSANLQ